MRRDFGQIANPELREALRRHERQIVNIGELHRLLAAEPGPEECEIAFYFQPRCRTLAQSVLAPLDVGCEVFLSEGSLPAEQCARLALVICELVMNAAKHAFPDNNGGCVRIDIFEEGDMCGCVVSDDGIGLRRGSAGCGSEIVKVLVAELGGRIFVQTGSWGTAISVVFPI
jgi:two-component sensor histidine kinase